MHTRLRPTTAFVIRKGIKYDKISPDIDTKAIEFSVIRLNLANNEKLFLISAYAIRGWNKFFIQDLDKIFNHFSLHKCNHHYILAGDLNARHPSWGNSKYNDRGNALFNWVEKNAVDFRLSLLSTYLPSYPNRGTFLDLVLTDKMAHFQNLLQGKLRTFSFDSDHLASYFSVTLNSTLKALTVNTEKYRLNFNKADWQKFRNTLSKSSNTVIPHDRNLSIAETEKYLASMDEEIRSAIDASVPKFVDSNSVDIYLTPKIRELKRRKNQLLSRIHFLQRKMSVNPTPFLSSIFKSYKNSVLKLKEKIHYLFAKSINDFWNNKIKNIPHNNGRLMFQQINKIFRKKGATKIMNLKIRKDSSQLLLDSAKISPSRLHSPDGENFVIANDKLKLNLLAAHFATVNQNSLPNHNERFHSLVERKVKNFLDENFTDSPLCSFSEDNPASAPVGLPSLPLFFTNTTILSSKVKTLNAKRSSGPDGIPNIAIKNLPRQFIIAYTILFNNLLNWTHFPDFWKTAKTVPILKKGKDGSSPSDYRPISLLSNVGKLFEMVINDALSRFTFENNIIPENQFGFRYRHSTIHAINKLVSDIHWALNDNRCVGACLIDLEKAFDSVWHVGLTYKLISKKFPPPIIRMVWVMISGRSFSVSGSNEDSSNRYFLNSGLQQGTINAPLLFNIFTASILELYGPSNTRCSLLAFADDLIVYRADAKPLNAQDTLQAAIEKIFNYYNAWKLRVNTSKCECILFRQSIKIAKKTICKTYKHFQIKASGGESDIIPRKKIVKYLGIFIDERLSFTDHFQTQIKRARAAFLSLGHLFYSKHLSPRVKILAYQALIRPIITYGAPIWYNISASLMEEARIFERKCLRAALNSWRSPESNYSKNISNKKIYNMARVNRLDNFIIKLVRKHFAKTVLISENSLIFPIPHPDPNYIAASLISGFVPPEAFPFLDGKGLIQSPSAVPVIYHVSRGKNDRKILYYSHADVTPLALNYNTAISDRDIQEREKLLINDKDRYFWWLHT